MKSRSAIWVSAFLSGSFEILIRLGATFLASLTKTSSTESHDRLMPVKAGVVYVKVII